jgi:hypothetical protein
VATVITRLEGGLLGRLAAHHSGVPRIVQGHCGFPFHGFQPAPPPPRLSGHRAPPWPADGRDLVRELLPAWSRLRAEALRSAYATGLAPITVSSANWPSPTLGRSFVKRSFQWSAGITTGEYGRIALPRAWSGGLV